MYLCQNFWDRDLSDVDAAAISTFKIDTLSDMVKQLHGRKINRL